jgi:hypothetical protein
MTSVEHPVHGVSAKDGGDLLFGGQQDERRLQEACANHGRRIRFADGDGTRSVRLEVVWLCRRYRMGGGGYKSKS